MALNESVGWCPHCHGAPLEVAAFCDRCQVTFTIHEGGYKTCPDCNRYDMVQVLAREMPDGLWEKAI